MMYPNYCTPGIVVVHGKSEETIVKHIRSSLRLNLYIHKRKTSIQINGLLHELETNFKNVAALRSNSSLVLNFVNKKPVDFKIFTIMDTDDCDEETKQRYINGSLFSEYALKAYVVPIYNSPSLEPVLFKGKIIPKIYNDSEKLKEYAKIFPISASTGGESKIDDMKRLSSILNTVKGTNMQDFLDYCIHTAEQRKIST